MQLKTIRKTLTEKMNQWLSSITDESLRKRVYDTLLVSGGSIANMFLKEPVNDYDIYLTDQDVMVDLAKYYCKPLGIQVYDGRKKEKYLKEFFQDKYNTQYNEKTYAELFKDDASIRATILRTLQPEQVKLVLLNGFLNVGETYTDEDHVNGKLPPYRPVYLSPNAISLSDDIQIVCRFTGSAEEIHSNYDFIHATNYFTMVSGVITNEKALISLLTRTLSYQGSKYPITSIIRTRKFVDRGFKINAGEYLKMCYQVSKLNLDDSDVLEEQLIGVDIAYFEQLLSILRGLSDEKRTSQSYLFSLINKIFN